MTLRFFTLIFFCYFSIGSAFSQASSGVERSLDAFLKVYGLGNLDDAQRMGARRLILSLIQNRSGDNNLLQSAKSYLQVNGYEVVSISVLSVSGTEYLIINDGLARYATKDLPIGLSGITFKSGRYFAKRQMLNGISEFIDADGTLRRLFMANWIELR